MDGLLKGYILTQKPNLRKDSIGVIISHIGKRIGLKTNISIKVDPHRKSQQSSGLLMPQSSSGSLNITYLEEPPQKRANSKNGGPQQEIKIRCMEGRVKEVHDGRGDAPQIDKRFIHHLNGRQLFQKYGNAITINASGAAIRLMDSISTTSNHSLIKSGDQIRQILSSYVKNATILFIAKRMLGRSI